MSKEKYVLALDQGTTSSRAILFNRAGMIIGQKQIPFRQIYPQAAWVEHDPKDIWQSQLEAAKGAIAAAQIQPAQLEAIGISNQRETTLVWERATGEPVHNAIVWQCRRSATLCQELRERGLEAEIRNRTGLLIDPYFSATKIQWLLKEIPGLRARAERGELAFGTVDTWLTWMLTGRHVTDVSNASRTMLYNIHECRWDGLLLKELDIPRSLLPEVIPSSAEFGMVKKELFGAAVPLAACAGDQQAALFGHACFEPGAAKNTYGTGCFTLLNTGKKAVSSQHRLLTTIAWDLGDGPVYALEGSVFIAGAVIQWLRDEMGLLKDAAESEALARSVEDSGGVIIVPAFVGLGAPHWDADARGAVFGITRGTNRAHFVRAALESIAFQSNDLLAAMESDCGQSIPYLKADGGASANSFLLQFQADLMGRRVILPESGEVSALGAAYLAGLKTGYWSGLDELARNWKEKREFVPEMNDETRSRLLKSWQKAVGKTTGGIA